MSHSAEPPPIESLESSSPIVTRQAAAGLRGEYAETYAFAAWQRIGLRLLGRLPQAAARWLIPRFDAGNGLDPGMLAGLKIERLARERLADYEAGGKPFPAVTLGAALGGASAHLALALGGPFLPQAFVATLRGGSPSGDALAYFRLSADLARQIAQDNPDVLTIQHYDPVHDGWMTGSVNHLRFKLLDLPAVYAAFIRANLQPGGAVCYLDCAAQWLRYRLGERSVFQVGGWGDISAQEFLEGSPRLQAYCREVGLEATDWRLPGFPLEQGPESEWGCEAGLGEALQDFCRREGYRFVRVSLPEPHDYSRLAFRAAALRLAKAGREPAGVLVEMFSQFDVEAAERSGLLPLWLIFNTRDSLEFLQAMRPHFPPGKPVFFSPLATFSLTPDLTPWAAWEAALDGLDWTNVGARPSHYPADALALVEWAAPLRAWAESNRQPPPPRLDAEELQALAQGLDVV